MSYLQYPPPRDNWCPVHQRTFYGFRCPQCIEDEKNKRIEKFLEPVKNAEQKRKAQEQLRLILANLGKATLVKETVDYKLSICPVCHQESLFFYKRSGLYECFNSRKCGLNSTIRLLTEQSKK